MPQGFDDEEDTPEVSAAEAAAQAAHRKAAIEAAKARPPIASLDSAYKMVGPVLMGMVIGYFLDQQLHTRPWWFLGMTFFGLLTGFWSLLKPLYFASRDTEAKAKSKSD